MKLFTFGSISLFVLLSSSCTLNSGPEPVVYDPGYSNDYVYSVGFYTNRPFWGNNYYSYHPSFNWGSKRYWRNGYYNGY
jgi:hypothetical protein